MLIWEVDIDKFARFARASCRVISTCDSGEHVQMVADQADTSSCIHVFNHNEVQVQNQSQESYII